MKTDFQRLCQIQGIPPRKQKRVAIVIFSAALAILGAASLYLNFLLILYRTFVLKE